MILIRYTQTMWYLLKTDFEIFKQTIFDKLIDLFIWVVAVMFVYVYLMPYFGLSAQYNTFLAAGLVASAGLFECYASITTLINDLEGTNITAYYLTLPMPSWLVFFTRMIFYCFNSVALSIMVLPVIKLLLWNHINLEQLSIIKFFCIFLVINFFYGGLTIWTASFVKGIEHIGSAWMRFVYPIWFLGGYQFSWYDLAKVNSTVAYCSLINPMIYAMEAMRVAILGQENYLPFWLCLVVLFIFSCLLFVHGTHRLKKRLDFV